MSARVLVTCPQMQRTIETFRARLHGAGVETVLPEVVQALSAAELLPVIGGFDGMIAGDDEITAEVVAAGAAGRLRTIAKWGVGVDGIDRAAAAAHGISVTNTPGAFGEEVADVALGYVLMLARRLHAIDASVQAGGWDKPVGLTLAGQVCGVVGLGSIGRATVRRAAAFGMEALGHDVVPVDDPGAVQVELPELLARSRFVVLCCPLTPENRGLIGEDALGAMRSDAYVVNVARGPLVDERALAGALARGAIAGAALDVFEVEPLPQDSPLRGDDRVILGSHNGSNTAEGTLRVSGLAVENLIRELERTAS